MSGEVGIEHQKKIKQKKTVSAIQRKCIEADVEDWSIIQ